MVDSNSNSDRQPELRVHKSDCYLCVRNWQYCDKHESHFTEECFDCATNTPSVAAIAEYRAQVAEYQPVATERSNNKRNPSGRGFRVNAWKARRGLI